MTKYFETNVVTRKYNSEQLIDAAIHAEAYAAKRPELNGISDWFAFLLAKVLRMFADLFFFKRYGNRAVMLETVAAIPGFVGATQNHLRALLKMNDYRREWVQALIDEGINERMHLEIFRAIIKPTLFERVLTFFVQIVFFVIFWVLYMVSPRTMHRLIDIFEQEATKSYTGYLAAIQAGEYENVPAPQIAIDYYGLPADARLYDVVECVRADEVEHSTVNGAFADTIDNEQALADEAYARDQIDAMARMAAAGRYHI